MVEQMVERRADLPGLTVRVGVAFGNPGQAGDLAMAERGPGDLDGGGGDPAEGAQLPSDDHRADAAGDSEPGTRDGRLDHDQLADRVLHVVHGQPGQHPQPVALQDGDPVGAESGDGPGVL